ncbi:hypothetical protein PSQ40_05060 [Curvibacter sp. HBC61]|uniref:Uncharacterized protein n=1 Tax=Curvibacter cyanobacteriorum TaxID=3026422 RepID=A0ABT5MXC3_9BURK|nr:hypothetical protein [Curvibacter sp. HBC61]MDD0837936.1 hypothetical protein [Curvibacter sp. HBC61]
MMRSSFRSMFSLVLAAAAAFACAVVDASGRAVAAISTLVAGAVAVFHQPSFDFIQRLGRPPAKLTGDRERIVGMARRVEGRRMFSTWRLCPSI